MENLSSTNQRSNDGTEQVGSCFIISNRYPQFSFMVALVDLPIPSEGFEYAFTEHYQNGWLTYSYTSDPNQPADAPLKTYLLPPYATSQTDIDNNVVKTITVVDSAQQVPPKQGTVSTIKFAGKWEKPTQAVADLPTGPEAWYVNAFIIQSYTLKNQYFLVATCDIMPTLDGYNGPYTNVLIATPGTNMGGGNLQVTPTRPTGPELGETEITAIYTTEITMPDPPPFTLGFFTVGVNPLLSSENVSQNYMGVSSDTPDATI